MSAVSQSLVNKIIKKPEILFALKNQLHSISFNFSSPLYIGMSKNLLSRVQNHKKLIETYKSSGVPRGRYDLDGSENADHNFASRVVSKKFVQTQLYLVYEEVDDDDSFHNVFENILNRINYPLLGRN